MELKISFFKHVRDNEPQQTKLKWQKLLQLFEKPVIRESKDGRLFSPALLNGTRASKNVVELCLLVLDYDHHASLTTDLQPWLDLGISFFVYTTYSHKKITKNNPEAEDRFRIVIPLAKPIPANLFLALWKWSEKISGNRVDTAAKDLARIYYMPAIANPGDSFHFSVYEGEFLDWEKLNLSPAVSSQQKMKKAAQVTIPEEKIEDVFLKTELEQVNLNLSKLSQQRCDNRELWLKVLMALSELGFEGKELAKSWSKTSSKYDEADFERIWASIKPKDGITLASLRFWVEEDNPIKTSFEINGSDWPNPLPLPIKLSPIPLFPVKLIPEPFKEFLEDTTERMQCPLEFPAVTAIVEAAALIGNKISFRPKRHDDWSIIPNLWGALIAEPGQMKTPVFNEILKPIRALASKTHTEHEEAMKEWEIKEFARKASRNALKEEAAKVAKNKGALDQIQYDFERLNEPAPVEKRFIINDSTTEKIGILLNENPNGLLLYRDELTGWLASFEKPGRETDRAFFLEAWNGVGDFTFDRVGRGTLHIKNLTLSILGSIQPSPLARHIRATMNGSEGNDGLLQRFQLAVYPDPTSEWNNVDRPPNQEAKKRMYQVFENLSTIDAFSLEAFFDSDGQAYLRFEDEAQEFFDSWRKNLETQLRANDHPAISAHLTKYRKLMPALSLIFHIIDFVDGSYKSKVSSISARRAAAWCSLLETHARRIYSLGNIAQSNSASLLANRIQKSELPTIFRARDIYRHQWPGLTTSEETHKALSVLEDCRWIKGFDFHPNGNNRPDLVSKLTSHKIDLPARGKSIAFFVVNPKVVDKEL